MFEKLKQKDVDSLVDYRSRSPHGVRAHPTDEHFLPLFFALGAAAEKAKPERVYDAIDSGVLAMDAYVFSLVELKERRQEGADFLPGARRRGEVVPDVRVALDAGVLVGERLPGGAC